jgi:hypothetical protein
MRDDNILHAPCRIFVQSAIIAAIARTREEKLKSKFGINRMQFEAFGQLSGLEMPFANE